MKKFGSNSFCALGSIGLLLGRDDIGNRNKPARPKPLPARFEVTMSNSANARMKALTSCVASTSLWIKKAPAKPVVDVCAVCWKNTEYTKIRIWSASCLWSNDEKQEGKTHRYMYICTCSCVYVCTQAKGWFRLWDMVEGVMFEGPFLVWMDADLQNQNDYQTLIGKRLPGSKWGITPM